MSPAAATPGPSGPSAGAAVGRGLCPDALALPIEAVPLAVVDVETTGLYAASGDRVCEVAVGRAEPGEALAIWSSLVDPGRPIHPEAGAVNGIGEAELRDAPAFAAVIPAIEAGLAGALMVAHNAPFDLAFLAAEYAIAGVVPPAVTVLDTLALARRRFRFQSNGLAAVAHVLGVPVAGSHRAAADVATTYGVLQRLIASLRAGGCLTVADFLAAQGGAVTFEAPCPPELPEPLRRAVLTREAVTICYVDAAGRPSERVVEPLWVNRSYLIAFCRRQRAQRTFRLDRIIDAWLS